ncbi:hypothetical protein [Streptomyces sp. NPDC026092]|uniref:hypothetical protein n=1 Tax=Streptomyces sp. NPDC026092 TaxID=3154797 RepID=UPI0033E20153
MKSRLATAAVLGVAAMGMTLTAPAAHAASPSPTSAATCQNWTVSSGQGKGSGTHCSDGVVSGWVEDTKADGRCPYVILNTSGGAIHSPWVGPKGAKKNFSFSGIWGTVTYSMGYVNC